MRFGDEGRGTTSRWVTFAGLAGIVLAFSLGVPLGAGGCGGPDGAADAVAAKQGQALAGDPSPGGEPVSATVEAGSVAPERSVKGGSCGEPFERCMKARASGAGPDEPTCVQFVKCFEQKSQCANALCAEEVASALPSGGEPGPDSRCANALCAEEVVADTPLATDETLACTKLVESCLKEKVDAACDAVRSRCLAVSSKGAGPASGQTASCETDFEQCVKARAAGAEPDAPSCVNFVKCYESKSRCANALCAEELARPADGQQPAVSGVTCTKLMHECLSKHLEASCAEFRSSCLVTTPRTAAVEANSAAPNVAVPGSK